MDRKQRICGLVAAFACTSVVAVVAQGADHSSGAAHPAKSVTKNSGIFPVPMGAVGQQLLDLMPSRLLEGATENSTEFDGTRGGTGETCETAIVIPALPYNTNGTTATALDDYDTPNDECNGPSTSRDRVYSYTPAVSTELEVSLCGTAAPPGGHEDSRLIVYTGGGAPLCQDAVYVTCSDDATGCGNGRQAKVTISATGGTTYYFVVDGWNGLNGAYNIGVTQPIGSCCDVVLPIDPCDDGIPPSQCQGLAERFTLNGVCPGTALCTQGPVGINCPPLPFESIFGPGLRFDLPVPAGEDLGGWVSDAGFPGGGNVMSDGFWNLTAPISQVSWYSCYSQLGFVAICNKAEEYQVTFYADNNGVPGAISAGPFDVTATTGQQSNIIFVNANQQQISTEIVQRTAPLPVSVSQANGWVSIVSKVDAADPDCMGVFITNTRTNAGSESGDATSYNVSTDERIGEDFTYCLGRPTEPGACCDDPNAGCGANPNGPPCCSDGVLPTACAPPKRFTEGGTCAALDPECGQGACCTPDGQCALTDFAGCSGTWKPGVTCEFANCPPSNDDCASVLVESGGPPYQFTNTTQGATEDAGCDDLGAVSWEAFTTTECLDIVLDYCGTSPAFLATPLDVLMPSCCATSQSLLACELSNSARIGTCCVDDPPGYDTNFSVTFPRVPAGTWYYPVLLTGASNGAYVINVTGTECEGACVTCTGTAENEPGCSGTNDNCTTADVITCGTTVCGTSSGSDSDWYKVNVASASTLSWSVRAEFPVRAQIFDGALNCVADFSLLELDTADGCVCTDVVASACVTAGDYYLVVEAQPGANAVCGATYSATVACGAACSPVVGACCTPTSGCQNNSTQARCDAVNGHYQGDSTTCAANPCPARAANDECAGAITIPTAAPVGLSYVLDRRLLSPNTTDGTPSCAAGSVSDASAWFQWTQPATTPTGNQYTPINLSMCCDDGGELGDTILTAYRPNATCAQIAGDPIGFELPAGPNNTRLGCNDDSPNCGEQRADLCPNTITAAANGAARTYRFKVAIKDAGGADEEDDFTLFVRTGTGACNAITCPAVDPCPVAAPDLCPPGIDQTEPNCGTDYVDITNNGCSVGTVTGATIAFSPIACGQTVCGTTGNFTSNGVTPPTVDSERDRDWYDIGVQPDETEYTWTVQASGSGVGAPGVTAQIRTISVFNAGTECDTTAFAVVGNDDDCTGVVANAVVPPGRHAVTVFGRSVDTDPLTPDQPCNTPYQATLQCSPTSTLPRPGDTCGTAPLATAGGRFSGSFNTNGVNYTADGESSCDGNAGDSICCNNVPEVPDAYIRYTAPCTGRVTVDGCESPTPLLISLHSGCPARCNNEIPPTVFCDDGLGISCNTFGCGQGGSRPTLTFDVVENTTYTIRVAPTNTDAVPPYTGLYVIRISDCVDGCQEAGVPAATVTSAVSRRSNPHARVDCDTNLQLSAVPVGRKTEPHSGGVQEIRIGFDVPPGGGGSGFALFEATCPTGTFSASGQVLSGSVVGNELVLTSAGLTNARTYRIDLDATVTSVAGQSVFVRGLVGDVNSDGLVNATDRSVVVGAWTGPGGWSCPTDVNNSGATNATDRSVVVGAWTGGIATNCAP